MEIYKELGISNFLDDNNKFIIPPYINHIRIDVGLAGDACNSQMWLEETNDRFVFGIEPLEIHHQHLKQHNFGERFLLVKGAISNTPSPTKKTFYHLHNTGASSFLEPKDKSHLKKKEVVNTFSLEFLLDHIPWDRFEDIEHIKTDCEGTDYEAIKSIGRYLLRVGAISSEVSLNNLAVFKGLSTDVYSDLMNFLHQNQFAPDKRYVLDMDSNDRGGFRPGQRGLSRSRRIDFKNQELKFINQRLRTYYEPDLTGRSALSNNTIGD
tara:strand:+ start:55 stop:852 length:798 start_codon:yes stop_codon:yes gene_type:complete